LVLIRRRLDGAAVKLDRERRRQLRDNLVAAKERGRLGEAVKEAAPATGVTERHLYRLATTPVKDPERVPWEPSPRAIELYYELRGRAAKVARRLHREGSPAPGVRQVQRAFGALGSDEREFVKHGVVARRAHSGTLRWEAAYRNAIWQIDAVRLKIWVRLPTGAVVSELILVYPIDCLTRVIPGFMVAPTESSDAVLEALRDSILISADSPFGGVPEMMMFDNGMAFLAKAVTEMSGMLGFKRHPVQRYSPHQNGKVERNHDSLCEDLLCDKPLWRKGPRDERDRLLDENRNPASFKTILTGLRQEVHEHNFERPHSALGGLTPARGWELESTPIRTETPDRLRFACKNRKIQTVQASGVYKHGRYYRALELDNRVKDQVIVAWWLKDDRTVDVYELNGDFICTAVPHATLSDEQKREMKRAQRGRFAVQEQLMREAEERREKRFAPTNAPDGFEALAQPGKKHRREVDEALFADLEDLNAVVVE
jgi:putative transposase